MDFVLTHGSNDPLNVINNKHPLSGDINLVGSGYTMLVNDPVQNQQTASKAYVDSVAGQSGAIKPLIQATGDTSTYTIENNNSGVTSVHQNQTLFTADKNNGFRFSVLPSYQNGTIEDAGALSLASHGYVDTKTGTVSTDLHTNYWTKTESNGRFYASTNPSLYQTAGDVNQVKITVEGYTDNAVADLQAHVPYRTRDLPTDPWYYDCRYLNNPV